MANYGVQLKDTNGNAFYPCPFPIGSIYLSVNNINPSTYWGGTWVKMSGGCLYGCQESITNSSLTGTNTGQSSGNTGGTALSITQIPRHNHSFTMNIWNPSGTGWYQAGLLGTNGGGLQASGWTNWNIIGSEGGDSSGNTAAHSHSLNSHTHAIPYIGVWVWKRTA